MREIHNCPSTLAEGFNAYCPDAALQLFGGEEVAPFLDFEIDGKALDGTAVALNRISVSGVQEKFSAVVDSGKIRLATRDERSTHILKPAPWDVLLAQRNEIPANEHLTMQIASQVYGIATAPNGLCFSKKGKPIYITRRFDVAPDGTKSNMEDFSVIAGRNEQILGSHFKYDGCYADIADGIRRISSDVDGDLMSFFNILVFNYIYANGDAHLKNFTMIFGTDGRCVLSPAYDLLNTRLHVNDSDFALDGGLSPDIEKSDVYLSTQHPCRLDFERFGLHIGLSADVIKPVLDSYSAIPERVKMLVANSFLSAKMKRMYLRVVEERCKRYGRG